MESEKLAAEILAKKQNEIQKDGTNEKVAEIKTFFKVDLLKIAKLIFLEPIKGTLEIFSNAGAATYGQALILIVTTTLVYTTIPYLIIGTRVREYLGFSVFIKLGLSVSLVLIIISVLSFGIKAFSGKPDFKKELLTGALCGIPLMIFLLALAIFAIFKGDSLRYDSPRSLMDQGIFLVIFTLYLALLLFNIVQQSFKASGTNDALSWYLSPLVISAAFYTGVKIAMSIFGPPGYHSISPYGY